MSEKRQNRDLPAATTKYGWRFHHLGIPHASPMRGERHIERLGIHVRVAFILDDGAPVELMEFEAC